MKIIISPAKKMKENTDEFPVAGMPQFWEDANRLMNALQSMTLSEAKALWKCSDKLAELNYERLKTMALDRSLTPAIIAYEGLQYQHMSPGVFTTEALAYISQHLRILSGFYGVLCPFDGVVPYRLEMQAKLSGNGYKDLYEFWGDRLYQSLAEGDRTIINLASKEYSRCIENYLKPEDQYITVEFGEWKEGKVVQKGTLAKMARGEMVRFLAENQIQDVRDMKEFQALHFSYSTECSSETTYVFLKENKTTDL